MTSEDEAIQIRPVTEPEPVTVDPVLVELKAIKEILQQLVGLTDLMARRR